MNYFDLRTGRALMDQRLREAAETSRRNPIGLHNATKELRRRLGTWMISRGERLVNRTPKVV